MSAERMPELPRNFLGLPYPKETKKQFNRALDLYEEVQTILEGASNTACPYEHVRRLEWRCTEWEGLASYFEKERFLQISGWMSKFVLPWIREGEKLVNKSLGNLDLNVGLSLSSYQVERLLHTYTVFRIRDSIGDSYAQEVKDETIQEISEGIAGKIENLCPIFSGLRQDNGLSDRLELMTGTLAGTDSYSLLHRKPVFDPNIIDRKLMAALKNLRQSLEGPVAQGKNLGQEKQLVIPVPPEEMRDFVGQRGKILGVIQGGQSWFFRLKGPKGLFGMSIFTGNGDEKIIERRRANAERIAQAAERLPKEFEGAKMPIILEHGTVFKYGWDFVLMELIEGNDLAKIVAKGPLPTRKRLD